MTGRARSLAAGAWIALAAATCSHAAAAASPREPSMLAEPLLLAQASGQPAAAPRGPEVPLDPAQEQRLKALLEELRCLVCQNQTLADSDADLAVDLRNEVRRLVAQNKDDARVKEFLVQRYGDFVLYRPPVQNNTWLLWFGPFALLAVGAVAWAGISRSSRRRTVADKPIDADERARGRRLLEDQ